MSHLIFVAVPEDASPTTWEEYHRTVEAILSAGAAAPRIAGDQPVPVAQPASPLPHVVVSQPQPQAPKASPKARFPKGSPEAKAAMAAVRAAKGSSPKPAAQPATPSASDRMAALAAQAQPQPAAVAQPAVAKLDQPEQAKLDAVRFAAVDAASISPEGWQAVRDWATSKLQDGAKIADVADFLEGNIFLGKLAERTTQRGRSNLALDIAKRAGLVEA